MKKILNKLKYIFNVDKEINKLSINVRSKLDKEEAERAYLMSEEGVTIRAFEEIMLDYYPKDVMDKKIKELEDRITELEKMVNNDGN